MAEDDTKAGKTKFKSKWGRVFREKEEHEQNPKHTNSFKLNDDVNDFLKPSTDKAAASTRPSNLPAPKLDVAIAQRWPDAHEVRRASATPATPPPAQQAFINGYKKPKRRQGLAVGFVRTQPEIIGEGGDECEEPASEVGRMKAARRRAVSDIRPGATGGGLPLVGTSSTAQNPRQARLPNGNEDDFRPGPLRRVQTSHNEFSPPVQRKQMSPPVEEESPERLKLTRTPTGLDTPADARFSPADEAYPVPRIDTSYLNANSDSDFTPTFSSGPWGTDSPRDPDTMAARRRELRSSEGRALRRASAMIMTNDTEDDDQKRASVAMGFQPTEQLYDTLSRPDAESLMPEVPEPRSAVSPQSAASPVGRSPFADPKYINRRSQEITQDQQNQLSQSLRQQRPANQPSYMNALQPPTAGQALPRRPVPEIQQPKRPDEQPSYMRAQQQTAPQPQQPASQTAERPSYMRAIQPPSSDFVPSRPAPAPSQSMGVPQAPRSREPSPLRERLFESRAGADSSRPMYARPNGSSNSVNRFPPPSPKYAHSQSSSHDDNSPRQQWSAGSGPYLQPSASPRSPHFPEYNQSPQSGSPRSSTQDSAHPSSGRTFSGEYSAGSQQPSAKSAVAAVQYQSPTSRPSSSGSDRAAPKPVINFSAPRAPQVQKPKAPAATLQREEAGRPSTSDSGGSAPGRDYFTQPKAQPQALQTPGYTDSGPTPMRPAISPQPPAEGNPAADAAYNDFAARVAHMKGVFRLTAEKEQPADRCTPASWLRTAHWWYLRGKAGLETMLQQRPRSNESHPREFLAQPHVDLAKTWWILADPLDAYDSPDDISPQSSVSTPGGSLEGILRQSVSMLRSYIKTLSLSMYKNQLMPPYQSLIQGQDTRIWMEYPRFSPDAAVVLGGSAKRSVIMDQATQTILPSDALPLGDSRDTFCYGRFLVEVSMSTDEQATDRVSMTCTLSMLRGKRDFLTSIIIASQNELVNVRVGPRQSGRDRGVTWNDVSWKTGSFGMTVQLPHNFDLTVRMHEKDFRSLWNLVEYARKVERSLGAEKEEQLVHEAQLAEMQYADSSNSNAFPPDKIRGAMALVFERRETFMDGGGERKLHRGYRLLLVTDPKHKSLASASHEVCTRGPLYFEFITDSAANGMAAMVIRIREASRQCRILLVFPDVGSRQDFYDVLNGLAIGPDEAIVGKMSLTGMNIESAMQIEGFTKSGHPALQALQWQKLGVTNGTSQDPQSRFPGTVQSENLRVIARHTSGCVTDRLNLGKGELLIRLPCTDTPAIQILREPQEDLTMSIDTRNTEANVTDGITELVKIVRQQPTIRTYTFASPDDLHAFQQSITGCSVRYDGLASVLGISRRMMVVPIYKKWEASNVRLQIVVHNTVVQLLAFMEGFSHADALCFQIKSTDTFETVKGNGKDKKWAVKMVDAKFSLPPQTQSEGHRDKDNQKGPEAPLSPEELKEKVKQRFVNLEMLEYAEEHDDITIGFETQEDRDKFAQALPAAAEKGRGLTLKRRI